MKKLILHIPHASTNIPYKDGYVIDDQTLQNEILKLTDWHTDDLYFSEKDDMVVADFSRVFCDPERFSEDENEEMASVGMGVLYERTDDGELMREITPSLRMKILNEYYWKHHRKLDQAVNQQLEKYGKAIIIDCHSLADIPFHRDKDKTSKRTDYSIGIDSFHTSDAIYSKTKNFFNAKGIEVTTNSPYSGTIIPLQYYQKNKNVQSIMIEINRKIYLRKNSNEKSLNYTNVKKLIEAYLNEIREML